MPHALAVLHLCSCHAQRCWAGLPHRIRMACTTRGRTCLLFRRPLTLTTRALEIGWRSASFGGTLLQDVLSGVESTGRAGGARSCVDRFCRARTSSLLGQRQRGTDLLPPAYVKSPASLQEDLPPCSPAEAREIIANELDPPSRQTSSASRPSPSPLLHLDRSTSVTWWTACRREGPAAQITSGLPRHAACAGGGGTAGVALRCTG